jgi:hypothetical protein
MGLVLHGRANLMRVRVFNTLRSGPPQWLSGVGMELLFLSTLMALVALVAMGFFAFAVVLER